jgi:L-lactate dehydrogenase complex protein LldG
MNARDTVLRRIRDALVDVPDSETPDDVPVPRGHRASHAGPDVIGLFTERAAEYRTTVVRVSANQAAAAVGRALTRSGAREVVVPRGFPLEFLPDGPWARLDEAQGGPPLTVRRLEAASAVVTTATVAIAVTGTIVLDSGPGQGRRVLTLLPDQHICVLHANQIAGDVSEALRRLDPSRPLTMISGPSATSDIELERVEGVHGPRTLDIIVIEGASAG